MVIHDETLDRTTNGSGYIKNMTPAEIKKLDAGSHFSNKFKKEKVFNHIKSNFEIGDSINYALEDIYEKRIKLVHPDDKFNSSWLPKLDSDDYYEYLEIAIYLFYYAITSEKLPQSKLI